MSREIKFRAWDKEKGKMMYPVFGYFERDSGTRFLIKADGTITPVYIEESIVHNPIPMQYTGLKDKNGKEIYEGDIVKVNIEDFKDGHPESPLLDIDYCNEVVEWNTEGGYWDLTGHGVAPLMAFTESQREVIGNIYENPELLKAKSNV